jgi:hypothetical protein
VTRQQGRPATMPFDHTPFDAPDIDVEVRVGWLLRVSRQCAADPDDQLLRPFVRRLRSAGVVCDSTRVSRWETGSSPAPAPVLLRYEQLLGLHPGGLRSVVAGLRSTLARHRSVRYDDLVRDPVSRQARLDRVYGMYTASGAAGGGATGEDWNDLAELLTDPQVLVPTPMVEELVTTLLSQMMRGVKTAYTTRLQALTRLITYPPRTATVVDAVETAVREPGAQGVVDAVGLLGEIGRPWIVPKLLTMLEHDTGAARLGAAHAVYNLLVTGMFPNGRRSALEDAVRRLGAADPHGSGARLAASIASHLPGTGGLPADVPSVHQRRPAGARAEADVRWRTRIDAYTAAAREDTGVEFDPMLERLLAEAVASRYTERRYHAGLLLMASPYRAVVARVAARIADTDQRPAARQAAASLLPHVAGGEQVPVLCGWLGADRSGLRRVALGALAHAGGPTDSLDLDALAQEPGIAAPSLVYVAGMTGHPILRRWTTDQATPWALRCSARWWLRQGSAVPEGR